MITIREALDVDITKMKGILYASIDGGYHFSSNGLCHKYYVCDRCPARIGLGKCVVAVGIGTEYIPEILAALIWLHGEKRYPND